MPIAYREKNRQMPGVQEVSVNQWVGAIYKDPANFFAQFAVDPERIFDVYPDVTIVAPEHKEAFLKERTAALAGVSLAERYGWKLDDRVTLEGTFIPGNIEVIIRGFVKDAGYENVLLMRYDYLNEIWDEFSQASTFAIKVKSPEQIAAVIDSIDGTFMNSTAPTKTETEKAFTLGFVAMLGNVRTLVVSISTVRF
jgi:putative ABC transport system permease protein